MKKYTQIVIKIQALYFFLTGIWPLVHLKSFMAITGEKTDIWLVHMVGLLAMSIGINLYLTKRDLPLAVCSAFSFALIDIIYTAQKTISPVYLIDAIIQLSFIFIYSVLPIFQHVFKVEKN